ncbi:MAG: hypothetical protein DWH70_08470 [Planctomycetota bacterium]|nr:MAG: hypothetical protein DWH70_08470 [Planctomycetota bacterium]
MKAFLQISRIFLLVLICMGFSGASVLLSQSTKEIAKTLSVLDPVVAKDKFQEVFKNQDWEEVRNQIVGANAKSSTEWKNITTKDGWEKYSNLKLAQLKSSLGKFPEETTQLNYKVLKSIPSAGYTIECIAYESRPGFWVTANLYRSSNPTTKEPGIIICPAHHTPKENKELQEMGGIWARAGCMVLVLDNLGHGERRQHPFDGPNSYPKSFRSSRQDYYFRYDLGVQLQLLEESLMGWMYWDIRRGVDLLLAQKGIAKDKIILLGAVAGGGDPAAVAGALDKRIAVVVPFNFGGPQPETKYPLPSDAETTFNYAGGGSWESTRNLRLSAKEGFLPWVIVGSIAPRKLIYGHEFSWDQENDPVWKRLKKIHQLHGTTDSLGFTTGRGSVKGSSPEDSHCTHIGRTHRQNIHVLLEKWLDIKGVKDTPVKSLASVNLKCLETTKARNEHPVKIQTHLEKLAQNQIDDAFKKYPTPMTGETLASFKRDWSNKLGAIQSSMVAEVISRESSSSENISITKALLKTEKEHHVPLLLLKPANIKAPSNKIAIMISQGGKKSLLENRSSQIAALLQDGFTVCLPDIRGTGELKTGTSRGRSSSATSLSSSLMMTGDLRITGQLRDLQAVIALLRKESAPALPQFLLWGDSPCNALPISTNFNLPRDDDSILPMQPEPLGGLLALFSALFNDDVKAINIKGGLASYASTLKHHLVQIPHETLIPGIFNMGDISLLINALGSRTIFLDQMVDGLNIEVAGTKLEQLIMNNAKERKVPNNIHLGEANLKTILKSLSTN